MSTAYDDVDGPCHEKFIQVVHLMRRSQNFLQYTPSEYRFDPRKNMSLRIMSSTFTVVSRATAKTTDWRSASPLNWNNVFYLTSCSGQPEFHQPSLQCTDILRLEKVAVNHSKRDTSGVHVVSLQHPQEERHDAKRVWAPLTNTEIAIVTAESVQSSTASHPAQRPARTISNKNGPLTLLSKTQKAGFCCTEDKARKITLR